MKLINISTLGGGAWLPPPLRFRDLGGLGRAWPGLAEAGFFGIEPVGERPLLSTSSFLAGPFFRPARRKPKSLYTFFCPADLSSS